MATARRALEVGWDELPNGRTKGLKNRCLVRGSITCPLGFRHLAPEQNPLAIEAKKKLRRAVNEAFIALWEQVDKACDDPDDKLKPILTSTFHYTHKQGPRAGATIFVGLRVTVSDAMAARLDELVSEHEAATKKAGLLPLPWLSPTSCVELTWEGRAVPTTLRLNGMHPDTDPDGLKAKLEAAHFKVTAVEPTVLEGDILPTAGMFDVTFPAGTVPPKELILRKGQERIAIPFRPVTHLTPEPQPHDCSSLAGAPAACAAPMSYAAAAARPPVQATPTATRPTPAATPPTRSRPPTSAGAPPGAPGGGGSGPKKRRRNQRSGIPQPPAAPVGRSVPTTSVGCVAICAHCAASDHAFEACPNKMDAAAAWGGAPDTHGGASAADAPPGPMETDGTAPDTGERRPAAAVPASPAQDGPRA